MKLHEYQAKRIFAAGHIPVPRSIIVATPEQAAKAYTALKKRCKASSAFTCNVKAQIHAGGRGKAGGVVTASSAKQAREQAATLLGTRLVTHQTGPEGLPVTRVLLDERIDVKRELYLALTTDRFAARPVILASREGGVDIETVAKRDPYAIVKELIDPVVGLSPFQSRRLEAALQLSGSIARAFEALLASLYACGIASDASIVEINPLVETTDGRLLALDAKIVLDDNALFRHPELAKLRDKGQEPALEYRASQVGVSYVGLEGNIGCLVNGAGLAMATNDIITLYRGEPANFLDVGGGANVEQVTKAFRIILADPRVRAILVNIFGGIMRCDWIAQGLLNATKAAHSAVRGTSSPARMVPARSSVSVKVPIVVRLAGTNVEEGRRLLTGTSLPITTAGDLDEAAQKVVALARKGSVR